MSIQQCKVAEILRTLPDDIVLVAEEIDYLDCQKTVIPKNITAYDAYKKMTSHQPKWLEILFTLRDHIVKLAGVRTIKGFAELNEVKNADGSPDTVHFFTIRENSPDKLTLTVEDSHLDVCLCMRIVAEDNTDKNMLYLVASVKNHNFFGKLYMCPVARLHPIIVKKLFTNIV